MQTRTLTFGWWECEFGTATLENNVAVSYKIRHTIAMQPSNPTPWYLSKTNGNYIRTKTWTRMFIVDLFAIIQKL